MANETTDFDDLCRVILNVLDIESGLDWDLTGPLSKSIAAKVWGAAMTTNDRGAKALWLRQAAFWHWNVKYAEYSEDEAEMDFLVAAPGLFIADVTKHEPVAVDYGFVGCSCGWRETFAVGESYFDHIGAAE